MLVYRVMILLVTVSGPGSRKHNSCRVPEFRRLTGGPIAPDQGLQPRPRDRDLF
jgi:hypothetical protein